MCLCVCLSVNSSYNYEPIELKLSMMSLPPLKTGSKFFFDRTQKKFFVFFWVGIASGPAGYEHFHISGDSHSFNPIELKLCRCTTLALTYYPKQKKLIGRRKILKFFLNLWDFSMKLAAGHYCLPQELA